MNHPLACRHPHLLLGKVWALLAPIFVVATTVYALAQATPVAPVQVTTSVEPRKVTVGSPFRYTMRVTAQSEVELVVPILADKIGDFLITDFGDVPHQPEGGKLTVDRWYTLVTYETGDKLVPGPTVQYRVPGSDLEPVDAPDALVIVESLLPGDESKADVRDIKPPVAVPRDYRPLWWAGAALVLLAGAGFGLYRLLNRQRAARVTPARPAHEVALEALARLHAARLLEEGRHEDYYVRLSAIVRRYLEDRFGLRAPEMTTEEFLQAAQQSPRLPRDHRSSLGRFLAEADLVKFARHVPEREEGERAYAAARQFVESTRPETEVVRAAA
jgi:hypothetical protein